MPSSTPATNATVPIVDFKDFHASTEAKAKIADQLVHACRDVGFVYITNHGLPANQLARAFQVSKEFYDLPTEEKMKAPHPPGWAVHRGYSWPGLEKVSDALGNLEGEDVVDKLREVQDYKESYEVGSEANKDQPNVWPPDDIYPEWRSFMTAFYCTCFEAAKDVLRALAIGLGLQDEEHLLKLHSGDYNQLRLLHYPQIPAQAIEGGKFARMPAHTDWSTISILFQDDCGGLQVEDPKQAGKFIDVQPIPGSLVVNVGDLLARWSNDHLKSTKHRVVLPPLQDRFTGDERMTRERYSIVYFLTTDPDEVIECLKGKYGEEMKYKPITQREYAGLRARMQYQSPEEEANALKTV